MIKKQLGLEVTLIEGETGVFDVVMGKQLIFSKKQVGRFISNTEIIKIMQGNMQS